MTPRELAPLASGTMHSTSVLAPRRPVRHPPGSEGRRPMRLSLSDDDLHRHVALRLSKFGPQVTRAVRATVRGGEVTLTGAVDSDYERRVVGQMVGMVAGVHEVTNLIEIQAAEQPVAKFEPLAIPVFARTFARIAAITLGLVIATWAIWWLASAVPDLNVASVADAWRLDSGNECRITVELPG